MTECVVPREPTWPYVVLVAITTIAGVVSSAISAFNRRDIHAVKRAVNGTADTDP